MVATVILRVEEENYFEFYDMLLKSSSYRSAECVFDEDGLFWIFKLEIPTPNKEFLNDVGAAYRRGVVKIISRKLLKQRL